MRTQTNDAAPPVRQDHHVAERPRQERRWPPLTRAHKVLFAATIALYVVVVAGVLTDSWLVTLDWDAMLAKPYKRWPELLPYLNVWIVVGQRGPSAIAAVAWLVWRSNRTRSLRPLLVMAAALLLLNMTVGAVKVVTGRLGPHYAHYIGSPELFAGGQIFPSGHTANSVVTWGVIAYLAVRLRRTGSVAAGFTAFSIGLTTVYLGTHWISDVIAGWTAGLLVLLVLPLFEPVVATADERIRAAWSRRGRGHAGPTGSGGRGGTDWSAWDEAVQDELAGVAAAVPALSPGGTGPGRPGRRPTRRSGARA
ncbi:phosphatase PAP2 family protein [Streptacidiphilus sp. ASG 303]|uniref:phosphatase PAP2 family protein n=1 Tax=Streptacidiphilus sp. ASG 303 TaxID=2896847 RepID=UPI001E4D7FCA|nr:phosphatase PAP2 family protein [Streptacidiphilus sp. ASG 303]MCD0483860.1 phosphatase PAP2 family protein [Streptacidiphilus sp. ASG 303]